MKAKTKAFIERYGGSSDDVLLSRYAYRVSDTIASCIKGDVSNDPVAKQYIPQDLELITTADEDADPIGDDAHTPVKGIVHRYPDRVLFKPANVCAIYCRYCFRREMVGQRDAQAPDVLSDLEIDAALSYIAAHKDIWEVILTGGDPLVLSPKTLAKIIGALNSIEHVQVVRIHSRVPIADPSRMNEAVYEALSLSKKALYVLLHINHAQEIHDDVRTCIKALRDAGVQLLSQSVLLKGVNDNVKALEDLFRSLVAMGVKPYYLHHPDLARGTSHFRMSIEQGQALMRALQGRLSGLCLPTYMLDIPGGYGKVPLTPAYYDSQSACVIDYCGQDHSYQSMKESS